MNSEAEDSDSIEKLFKADLEIDIRHLKAILSHELTSTTWEQCLVTLGHINSCAKLTQQTLVVEYIEAWIRFLQQYLRLENAPKSTCRLLVTEGLRPLEALCVDKTGASNGPLLTETWLQRLATLTAQSTDIASTDEERVYYLAQGTEQEGILALFASELETQVADLNRGLLRLEHEKHDALALQLLMRAAHSIKGAARVVALNPLVQLAHLMEECFVNAQQKQMPINETCFEVLFEGIDFLAHLSKVEPKTVILYTVMHSYTLQLICQALEVCRQMTVQVDQELAPLPSQPKPIVAEKKSEPSVPLEEQDSISSYSRTLRINAETLNRLMGLAGEALVESRWLPLFAQALVKYKREYSSLSLIVDQLRLSLQPDSSPIQTYQLNELLQKVASCQRQLNERLSDFDMFARRYSIIAERLYRAVIESRMRPFADIVSPLPRMVRDLAKQLHKKVHLEIQGGMIPVDREILEKLEAPLAHLLRNAVDHGIEEPNERLRIGKPEEGLITLQAQQRAGMLAIEVYDNGQGIDLEQIKKTIVHKQLASEEMVAHLSKTEIYDFMFLPGFSTAKAVTDISGRGVGLGAVQTFVQEVGGRIRLESQRGQGLKVHMLLPLTLSVMRALLIQVAGELYALPLAKIDRVLTLERSSIEHLEQRPYFLFGNENIGLVTANEILELPPMANLSDSIPIVILGDLSSRYGIVVEGFMGEKELVVHELDPLLGKVPNVSAGAFAEDGSPILILDTEDLMHSIDLLLSGGRLRSLNTVEDKTPLQSRQKKILIVDDSITVREVECRLLANHGYTVDTAVNGMDGWNAVRSSPYDLVITDIDMPRMNGIEFVKAMRADPRYQDLPIMIVSYKEREEDRMKGLEAGANYYLTKSSFHDETLVQAVRDLIGDPTAYP